MRVNRKLIAQALWKNIERQSLSEIDALLNTLRSFQDLYAQEESLRMFLNHPRISMSAKEKLIQAVGKVMQADDLAVGLLALLLQLRQVALLLDVLQDVTQLRNTQFHIAQAVVTSREPLSPQVKQQIQAQVAKMREVETVELTEKTDASLLGGIVLQVDDMLIDDSLRRKMYQLRHTLTI